eukprot:TRINITY_DN98085_c0_g1_i1.p2 TRINITY_DN98085_c0_g1~~TRINITY_DN98085_c0_g1_i1.p2  ORF type:complete len:160 (-),score=21.89 TRINITY_DN98085_c0_g1_i1:306-785(-)
MAANSQADQHQKTVQLESLDLSTLNMIKEQLEREIQQYSQSVVQLQKAAAGFGASGKAIEQLQISEVGQEVLVPLSESLYVQGEVHSNDRVLIDIGTGYFVEQSTEKGIDYCRRKVKLLREKLEELSGMLSEKQGFLQQVNIVMKIKIEQQQQQQSSKT